MHRVKRDHIIPILSSVQKCLHHDLERRQNFLAQVAFDAVLSLEAGEAMVQHWAAHMAAAANATRGSLAALGFGDVAVVSAHAPAGPGVTVSAPAHKYQV